jgi:hypothetical protein
VGAGLFHADRDGQAYVTELTVAFSEFCENKLKKINTYNLIKYVRIVQASVILNSPKYLKTSVLTSQVI